MFKRIATGDSGEPVVLAELNEFEKASLTRILRLAEEHLDEIRYPKVGSRRMLAESMIMEMRRIFEVTPPEALPEREG